MSYPPQYPPQPQYTPVPSPPPAPPRYRTLLWAGLGALAIVTAGVVAVVLLGDRDPSQAEQAAAATGAPVTEAAPTSATPTPIVTPSLTALILQPQIIDKQCFGSAGCNVEFEVDVEAGPFVQEGTVWRVTYEVTGVEDAPLVGTFELTDGGRYDRVSELVQTSSSKAKIRVKATRIELMSS